ncbi:MAG: septum formation initiator family protein [Magnetococcus sp. DMHC-6]
MMNGVASTPKSVLIGIALLIANGWAQYLLWFGDLGLVHWQQTAQQLKIVKQENFAIEEEIRLLKEEIFLMEKDISALEEVARRDLGLAYPDEILFVLAGG